MRQVHFHLLLIGLLLFAGCTASKTVPDHDKMIVVALGAPPSTLDPRVATDATGTRIAGLLYSSLVRIGDDLKAVGDLAESWTQETPTRYVFKLRRGLKFWNSRAIEPADLDFTFEQFTASKSPFASAFEVIKSHSAEIKNERVQLTIELKRTSATFLNDLTAIAILPKLETELLKPNELPIGSGPFQFVSQSANEIVLKSWPLHSYAAPKSPGVIFKIVRDDNTRVQKMIKGELDLAQAEFPPGKIAELEKADSLQVYKYPGLALTYLLFNLKDPALANLKVRKAIAAAIDRESIIKYKLSGLATIATSLVTPKNPFFDSSLKPISFSPETARELIKGLKLPEFSLKTSSTPSVVENGRVIASDLSIVGFKIKQQSFEWGTFFADIQNGRFQLATLRWTGTLDPDLYRKALHSKETPPLGRNRGSYANAEVDRLTEEGSRTVDFEQRNLIYRKVQQKVFEDLPFVPLWYDTEVAVASRRLIGYVPPPDGSFWPLTKVEKK